MTTTIYYFSGSGNSLKIARSLAKELGACELIPMARLWRLDRIIVPQGSVGFAFPMYYYGLPDIVGKFVSRLDLTKAEYIFTVVTTGGASGCSLQKIDDILGGKGRKLDVGFYVDMPSNYIPLHDMITKEKQQKLFTSAEKKVKKIAKTIMFRKTKGERDKPIVRKIAYGNNRTFLDEVNMKDTAFDVDRNCISCGFCARVCPVDNIQMVGGLPQWQHHCQHCLACLHFCPKECIQYTRKTVGRKRYHHPDITFKDIESQKWKVAARKIKVKNLTDSENGHEEEQAAA